MKIFRGLLVSLFLFGTALAFGPQNANVEAAYRVSGYYRSSGTYVQSYYRTSPNRYTYDNYSSKGNYNPYSGSYGTKSYNSLYNYSYRNYTYSSPYSSYYSGW